MIEGNKSACIHGFVVKKFYVNRLAIQGADIDMPPVAVTLEVLVGAGIGFELRLHRFRAGRQHLDPHIHRAIATGHEEVQVVTNQFHPIDLESAGGGGIGGVADLPGGNRGCPFPCCIRLGLKVIPAGQGIIRKDAGQAVLAGCAAGGFKGQFQAGKRVVPYRPRQGRDCTYGALGVLGIIFTSITTTLLRAGIIALQLQTDAGPPAQAPLPQGEAAHTHKPVRAGVNSGNQGQQGQVGTGTEAVACCKAIAKFR